MTRGRNEGVVGSKAVLFVALLVAFTMAAQAGVVYQTGFENPPFTVGGLSGQDVWLSPSGTAQVESTVALSGAQSVLIIPSGAGLQAVGITSLDGTVNPVINLQADILMGGPLSSAWTFGALNGSLGLIGGITILNTGQVVASSAGSPVASQALSPGTLYTLDLLLNFGTGTFSAAEDGSLLFANLPFNDATSTVLLGGAFASDIAGGVLFVDNYSVSTIAGTTTPEPTTLALLGAGFLALGFCRTRSKRA